MDSLSSVCVACLSYHTDLLPLGEYLELYKMLLGKENDQDSSDVKPFTCSDCQDMFQKIQIFQQKIRSSQEILLMRIHQDPQLPSDNVEFLNGNINLHKNIEVQIDYLKSTNECKDEPFEDDSMLFDADDNINLIDIKQEPEETTEFKIEAVKEEDVSNELKSNKKKYRRYKHNVKPKILSGTKLVKNNFRYYTKKVVSEDAIKLDDEARMAWSFRSFKHKCRSCVLGFKESDGLQKHLLNKHSETIGPYLCDICSIRTPTKEALECHVKKHYYNYYCTLCDLSFHKKWQLRMHFVIRHKQVFKCPKCGIIFTHRRDFNRHYKLMHERFICDHCGKLYTDRHWFENHLLKFHTAYDCKPCNKTFRCFKYFAAHNKLRHTTAASENTYCVECDLQFENQARYKMHIQESTKHLGRGRKKRKVHTTFECKPCNKTFRYFKNFDAHNKLLHTTAASESTYCVECDLQFENQQRYKRHIQNSTRHFGRKRKKSANCPECGKHYACRSNMMNHYRLEHLKVTNYQCKDCSRFFLNSYRLKEHRLVNHEKKGRAKNKICSYCGRGFSNNRILLYHVRTHTGERPHACALCPATFAQPFALATHVRARHKHADK